MGEKKLHENKLPRNVWTLGNDDFSNRRKNEYFVIFAQVFVFSCFLILTITVTCSLFF